MEEFLYSWASLSDCLFPGFTAYEPALFFGRNYSTFSRHEIIFLNFKELRNRFQGMNSATLCSLAGRYDNPIPSRFLAPINCSKIPAQARDHFCWGGGGGTTVLSDVMKRGQMINFEGEGLLSDVMKGG
jgi:hypothetical protein